MAGFFSRIFDRVFRQDNARPPEPPPPRQGTGAVPEGPSRFLRIWRENTTRSKIRQISGKSGYSERTVFERHLEVFLSLPGMQDTPDDEQEDYWREYIDAFIMDRRRKKTWLEEVGYDPRDYDWQEWRETRGYRER